MHHTLRDDLLDIIAPFPGIFAMDFGRYLLAAILVSVVLAMMGRYRRRRAVRTRSPETYQRLREFVRSIRAATVFAAVGLLVYYGSMQGLFRLYDRIADYGWAYWFASLALMVVAHDAYFYWTHRLLHRRELFAWTHRVHHQSVAPTQWAAYSFSMAESLVQTAFVPLFLLLIPMHGAAFFIWMAHQIVRNAMGHCGVELIPKSWLASWWGRWLTTTLHHDMHHAGGRHNYGLYFTWWDRWCGTEHPQYRLRLEQLIDKLYTPDSHTRTNDAAKEI